MPEHLTALPLFEDQRELVIRTAHFTGLSKNPELLTDIPLIVSHLDAPDLRPTIEKLRDSFGTIWEVNDLSQRINLVAQGLGMTYLDQRIRKTNARCRGLDVISSPSFAIIPLTFGIFYRSKSRLSHGAERFLVLCREFYF